METSSTADVVRHASVIRIVLVAIAELLEAELRLEVFHRLRAFRLHVEGRLARTRTFELDVREGIIWRGLGVDRSENHFDVDSLGEGLRQENRQLAGPEENGGAVLLVHPVHGVVVMHERRSHLDAIHGPDFQAAGCAKRLLGCLLVLLHHGLELVE